MHLLFLNQRLWCIPKKENNRFVLIPLIHIKSRAAAADTQHTLLMFLLPQSKITLKSIRYLLYLLIFCVSYFKKIVLFLVVSFGTNSLSENGNQSSNEKGRLLSIILHFTTRTPFFISYYCWLFAFLTNNAGIWFFYEDICAYEK